MASLLEAEMDLDATEVRRLAERAVVYAISHGIVMAAPISAGSVENGQF